MNNIKEQLYLFNQGTYYHCYDLMGNHFAKQNGKSGSIFRVWAPNAKAVSVVGDFNGWDNNAHQMKRLNKGGVWEVFVENTKTYDKYKYCITTKNKGTILKADPYAFYQETNGKTASMVYDISGYKWQDKKYQQQHMNGIM